MTFRAACLVLAASLLVPGCRPRGEVGILPFYPGARLVSTGESQGSAFGFGPAHWTRVTLVSSKPYDDIRRFYAAIDPPGWTSMLVNETKKESGRRYDRYLAGARRREFYAIQVSEEGGGTVRITLAWGRRGTPGP